MKLLELLKVIGMNEEITVKANDGSNLFTGSCYASLKGSLISDYCSEVGNVLNQNNGLSGQIVIELE